MKHFKQGKYIPRHPEKYIGDVNDIIYRSSWEYKFCMYCDFNPGIIKWSSEEIIIPYIFMDKTHRYFPDFYIEVKQSDNTIKKFIIEIKPQKDTKFTPPKTITVKNSNKVAEQAMVVSKNYSKWLACNEFCKKNNIEFKVITEKELF